MRRQNTSRQVVHSTLVRAECKLRVVTDLHRRFAVGLCSARAAARRVRLEFGDHPRPGPFRRRRQGNQSKSTDGERRRPHESRLLLAVSSVCRREHGQAGGPRCRARQRTVWLRRGGVGGDFQSAPDSSIDDKHGWEYLRGIALAASHRFCRPFFPQKEALQSKRPSLLSPPLRSSDTR
jgi:hypothetical protein